MLSFYSFFHENGIVDCSKCEGLWEGAKIGGWYWLYKDIAFVSERPIEIHRDSEGGLHHENKMAIKWSDGWGVYSYHGVRVSLEIIEKPDAITIEGIDKEGNAEIRRVMVERFGMERYLLEGDAKQIHKDKYGILYRKEQEGDEPIVMVQVTNSTPEPDTTFKKYFIRVPQDIQTAKAAVAWTFGREASEYQPVVET